MTIAVLMACYNRVETTIRCLEHLFACDLQDGVRLDVYLVDDASPDHTGACVQKRFSSVDVVQGTGKLYWCGGMRLAWKTARQRADYDYYLWLNDDVCLMPRGLADLFADYERVKDMRVGVIVGLCCDPLTGALTYGGRAGVRMLQPSGVPQPCTYIHGNIVLVPRSTFLAIGALSESYTHGFGDSDYGLRAIAGGLTCFTTSGFVATCCAHDLKVPWLSSRVPLKRRLSYLNKPIGANYREYLIYKKAHSPRTWWFYGAKMLVQIVFPKPFEWYWEYRTHRPQRKEH